jgi:hypothetical protein
MQRVSSSLRSAFLAIVVVCSSAASAQAAADFPVGSYTYGEFTITFEANGQFRAFQGSALMVEGEYTVTGDELRLTDKGGPMACTGQGEPGVYRWKLANDELALTKVDDKCDGRSAAMTAQAWKRKP